VKYRIALQKSEEGYAVEEETRGQDVREIEIAV
jgi:hypothetical protein